MTMANPTIDRSHLERKATAVELLRELAALLDALADVMEKSPINSADWFAMQLQSAQAAATLWQRRTAVYMHAWDVEDFEQQHILPPDL